MYYRRTQKVTSKRNGNRYILFPLIAILIVLAFGFLSPVHTAIVLEANGQPFLMFAVKEQNVFTITYTHSANKTKVVDTVERVGDVFVVRSTLFESYGAGMPNEEDYPGAVFEITGEGLLITGIDKEYPVIDLIVGSESNPTLHIKNEDCVLMNYVSDQSRVTISVGHVSLSTLTRYDPNLDLANP